MLKELVWLKYDKAMDVEWEQCMREGKDVASLKEECMRLTADAAGANLLEEARALGQKLLETPQRPDFPYEEPSSLEGIRAACLPAASSLPKPDPGRRADKVKGAWAGRIAGCLLGKPIEGLYYKEHILPILMGTGNYPMRRYIKKAELRQEQLKMIPAVLRDCFVDRLDGISARDDDTDYTVFALKLVEEYGMDFTPDQVLEGWLRWIPAFSTCTAERVAYRNALMGLLPPETALFENPYREFIGAQIRGDLFGYILPGNCQKAAELAWRDATISHVKNGIYGEMLVSAMLAAAAVTDDIRIVLMAALETIPAKSRLHADVETVIGWHAKGHSAQEVIDLIHSLYDDHNSFDWCYTNVNAMLVVMALLYSGGDVGKAMCLAVQGGFDTDCNGATAGSVMGMLKGYEAIEPCWTDGFCRGLKTSIIDYSLVSLEDLVERTLSMMQI